MVKPRGMLFMGFGLFLFWKKKKKRLILSLSLEHFCCQMCLLWYLLYLWYYLCVYTYIHTYIYIYIYIFHINKKILSPYILGRKYFLPFFFLLTVPRCVKSRPGSVIDSLLCIPFFFSVLVSRQFVDMSRIRIEGLLAAFPKLVGTGKQHTYVETENVRYVYQPIEALYLLLVTNKQSNILEDLETLRLLSKLVSFSWWYIFQFMFLYWVQHDFFDPPILDI